MHHRISGQAARFITGKIFTNSIQEARTAEKRLSQFTFTARYASMTRRVFLIIAFVSLCMAGFFWAVDSEKKGITWIPVCCALFMLPCYLYTLTYRCIVDQSGITAISFGVFRKHILWNDIYRVNVKVYSDGLSGYKKLLLKNKKGKVIFFCYNDLIGYELIRKRAKHLQNRS